VGLWPCRAVEVLIYCDGRETGQAVGLPLLVPTLLYFLFYDMNTNDGWMNFLCIWLGIRSNLEQIGVFIEDKGMLLGN
jgi:hypothetical protein